MDARIWKAIDEVDAAIFSGDTFDASNRDNIGELIPICERWLAELKKRQNESERSSDVEPATSRDSTQEQSYGQSSEVKLAISHGFIEEQCRPGSLLGGGSNPRLRFRKGNWHVWRASTAQQGFQAARRDVCGMYVDHLSEASGRLESLETALGYVDAHLSGGKKLEQMLSKLQEEKKQL